VCCRHNDGSKVCQQRATSKRWVACSTNPELVAEASLSRSNRTGTASTQVGQFRIKDSPDSPVGIGCRDPPDQRYGIDIDWTSFVSVQHRDLECGQPCVAAMKPRATVGLRRDQVTRIPPWGSATPVESLVATLAGSSMLNSRKEGMRKIPQGCRMQSLRRVM
jgi:hypothetical protein